MKDEGVTQRSLKLAGVKVGRNMLVTCGSHLLGRETDRPLHQLSAHPSKFKHLPTLHYSRGAEAAVIPGEKKKKKYTSRPSVALNILGIHGGYSHVTKTNTDRRVKTESMSRPKH